MNRQKFLAELAQLLSFMYEEDRRYALDMYERMFDIAEGSEQWLIQNLMSPTRQAVIIARSYDAKERKLSVSAEWKDEDGYVDEDGETPPFVLAINKIFDDLFPDEDGEETQEEDGWRIHTNPDAADEPKQKKPKMPKAAVLLNQTQEFAGIFNMEEGEEALPQDDQGEDRGEAYDPDGDVYAPEDLVEAFNEVKIEYLDRTEFESEETEKGREPADAGQADRDDAAPVPADGADQAAVEPEQEPAEQTDAAKANAVEAQLKEMPQPQAPVKKRRSIEELLGFGKKRSKESPEDKPQEAAGAKAESTADPGESEEAAQTAVRTDAPAAEEKTDAEHSSQPAPADGSVTDKEPGASEGPQAASAGAAEQAGPETKQGEPEEKDAAAQTAPAAPAPIAPARTEAISEEPETEPEGKTEETAAKTEPEAPADAAASAQKAGRTPPVIPEDAPVIRKPEPVKAPEENVPGEMVWNVPLLVLFLVAAIPLTLLALAILLIPLALFFSLSIGMIALGSVLVISAFSGFAVLADIMLLVGAAAIAMALGLLFLWLSFWLIGEGMVGLVRWVRELAEKCCRKEVPGT